MDSLQIKDAMSIEINFVQLKLETSMFSSKYPPPPHFIKKQEITLHKWKKNRQNTQRSIITNIKRLIGKKIFFLLKISANLAWINSYTSVGSLQCSKQSKVNSCWQQLPVCYHIFCFCFISLLAIQNNLFNLTIYVGEGFNPTVDYLPVKHPKYKSIWCKRNNSNNNHYHSKY